MLVSVRRLQTRIRDCVLLANAAGTWSAWLAVPLAASLVLTGRNTPPVVSRQTRGHGIDIIVRYQIISALAMPCHAAARRVMIATPSTSWSLIRIIIHRLRRPSAAMAV